MGVSGMGPPRSVLVLLCVFWCVVSPCGAATQTWIKARSGPFETISDDGRRTATESLSQFEQFRYSLGTVLGKPDLKLDPPIRILNFHNAAELAAEDCSGLRQGRERLSVCTAAEGQLPAATLKALTRHLLENNFSSMPAPIETALETFFSTIESKATHVTWGVPPPAAERTWDWAMLHRIITVPDYAGKARIYLHNLASGMDRPSAIRNAFGEDAARFESETEAYYRAGDFKPSAAPSRPINPDRDFNTTALTSDEGLLMRADLLNAKSADRYHQLIAMGKHTAEANEGLGLLELRSGDRSRARELLDQAVQSGSRNVVVITSDAKLQEDTAKSVKLLREALSIDVKYAPAHWALGETSNDPRVRLAEWKQATALAPRNTDWWVRYAQFCLEQKQFADAGHAWLAAAQSAPDEAHREEYLNARARIDEQRLRSEDEIRRAEQEKQAREIEQLKSEARREIAAMEAKAKRAPISADDEVFEWSEVNGKTVSGTLDRVECAGKQHRLHVTTEGGAKMTFLLRDAAKLAADRKLSCTGTKPRAVTLTYLPAHSTGRRSGPALPAGIDGEVMSMELR